MKFQNTLAAFAAEPWAIQREKLAVLADILVARADGEKFVPSDFAAAISDARAKEVAETDGSVAIIPIHGVLADKMDAFSAMSGGTSYQGIKRALYKALSSDDVKAIILDIDSPGGSVPGTDELASEIRKVRGGEKPIIAQVNSLAASAAYWIAAQADEIVVTPSGRAGSIGIYTAHDDLSAAMERRGIKRTYISAGKHKVEGNETEPLSEDALSYYQGMIDRSYGKFVSAVAAGRGVSKSEVEDRYGQGRVFYAESLIERGMADRIATLDETLDRFGAQTEPDYVRRIKISNRSRAEAAEVLAAKLRAGEPITKREFEHGLKGLVGLSNSEAERAARLYLKEDQGEPDGDADAAVSAALDRLLAETKSFKI